MVRRKLRKQQIMQPAIEVFGKSSYQYFKSKQDLFFSISLEKAKDFCKQIDLNLEGVTGALGKTRKLVWYYLYYFKSNPDYVRSFMLEMRVNRDFVKSRSYKSFRALSKQTLQILEERKAEGIIRNDVDIYLARHLLLGTLEHIVTRWFLKGEKYDIMQLHEQVSDLVLNGICSQTGQGIVAAHEQPIVGSESTDPSGQSYNISPSYLK